MASLIKTQIVKHLSKFAKNLSPNKIQLSTLKGEGELRNLELDENVLMELMDLPTWLKLNKAVCNKVNIKIQWSKLKSQPIQLFLDEILISMEMCEELRQPTNTSDLPSYSSGGRYGFGDRVVDGMFLQINAVIVNFSSKAFQATINLSRIVIQSKTPTWRSANDLQYTRISEKSSDLLLTFKEISWQTLKIEADCTVGDEQKQTTPLRLITNESKLRISVKKRYSDCSAVATKLQFIMDDLLWIITDSQMKAAVLFAKHLKDNIDKAKEQSKRDAAKTLEKQRQVQQKGPALSRSTTTKSPASSLFNKYDIRESSYHVQTGRVDLHICDDVNDENRKRLVDGGAVGIAVMKLQISHYPARTVGESRRSWQRYDDNMAGRDDWTAALIANYIKQLELDRDRGLLEQKLTERPERVASKLVERLTQLTVEDFFITSVSGERQHPNRPAKLLMSDKKALFLPTEMSAVHVEHTEYFFDHKTWIPAPCPNAYIRINPVKLVVDTQTLMWANSFALSLAKDVDDLLLALPIDTNETKERVELRLEALMPKIVFPVVGSSPAHQVDRPNSLQILISRMVITNNHTVMSSKNSSLNAHRTLLDKHRKLSLCNSKSFPHNSSSDIRLISPGHQHYADESRLSYTVGSSTSPAIEVMSVELEQFWMEFTGVRSAGLRPVSFLESFPVTVWLTLPSDTPSDSRHQPLKRLSEVSKPDIDKHGPNHISVLVDIGGKICAQLNHYQYCFLMRLADSFAEMADTMSEEAKLHKELFIKQENGKGILPTVSSSSEEKPPLTVILQVREVQFVMLTLPDVSPSHDVPSSLEDESEEPCSPGVGSISPPSGGCETDNFTVAEDLPMQDKTDLGLASSVAVQIDGIPALGASPPDTDSGIASLATGSSFTGSFEPDTATERSASLNSNSSKLPYRSSFNNSDTLFPPGTDSVVGNKFTSAFSKMTQKVRSSIAKAGDDSDSWDTLSITSGLSDDFDMLAEISAQEEEAAFSSNQTGGLNDDEVESVASASGAERQRQLVTVTVFNLCDIEIGLQTVEDDMVAKVAVACLHNEDRGSMLYDDFQAKQLSEMSSYMDVTTQKRPIRVRFSQGPTAAKLAAGAEKSGFAHIRVSDYALSFFTSTVERLGPLFNDEKIGDPLPLLIEVANFDFELKDDAAPVYDTDTPSVPVKLHVNQVSLLRSADGIITVQGGTSSSITGNSPVLKRKAVMHSEKSTDTADLSTADNELPPSPSPTAVSSPVEPSVASAQLLKEMNYLRDENKALKEQILRLNDKLLEKDHLEFERVESSSANCEDNFELMKELEFYKKETKLLRKQVMANGDQIDGLQAAKECLIETVRILKNEMEFHKSGPAQGS